MSKRASLSNLVLDYFQKHPRQDLRHNDWIDEVSEQYRRLNNKENLPRDPWRAARKLHQDGYLIKIGKGVYRYDPEYVHNPKYEDFTAAQKRRILETGEYRCARCGRGLAEGVELHIDHIKPKDQGGKATLENGQILCAEHNFLKKNLNATESGKRMFINLYEVAKREESDKFVAFTREILEVFDKFDVNGHIEWKP